MFRQILQTVPIKALIKQISGGFRENYKNRLPAFNASLPTTFAKACMTSISLVWIGKLSLLRLRCRVATDVDELGLDKAGTRGGTNPP